ncbi:MAG: hypothetical protein QXD98_03410 [Candidatus Diapherotrites archaeon]
MRSQSSFEMVILFAVTTVLVATLTYLVLGILQSTGAITDKPFDITTSQKSNILIVEPTTKVPFKIEGSNYDEIQAKIIQKKPAKLVSFSVIQNGQPVKDDLGNKQIGCEINTSFPLNKEVNTNIHLGNIEVYKISDFSDCPSENSCCLKTGFYDVKVEAKFYHNDSNDTIIEKKAVIIKD